MGEKVPFDKLIRIMVPRSGQGKGGFFVGDEPGKGINNKRRPEEFLPRRKRVEGVIRFFDCGRLANGTGIVDFIRQPAFPYDGNGGVDLAPFASNADFAALDAYLLDLPGESFEAKFYEITQTDADYYRLKLTGDGLTELLTSDNALWTVEGLKLTGTQTGANNFEITVDTDSKHWRNFLVTGFKTSGTFKNKVTLSNDFDDDEVSPFQLAPGDLVFLYPVLGSYAGHANWFSGGPRTYLHYDIRLGLRDFFVGNHAPLFDPMQFSWQRGFFTSEPNYLQAYNIMRDVIELPSARAWKIEYDFDLEDYIFTTIDPNTQFIPHPPFDPAGDFTATEMFMGNTVYPFNYPSENLLALVLRGADLYHIWGN